MVENKEDIAMFCKFCGAENEDGSLFCAACGKNLETSDASNSSDLKSTAGTFINSAGSFAQNLEDSVQRRMNKNEIEAEAELSRYDVNSNSPELKDIFVDPEETMVAKLGNGFLANILIWKSVRKCSAILSDKRVYFKGRIYQVVNGKVNKTTCMQTVDVEDVTGTGFLFSNYPKWLAILEFILAILTVVGFGVDVSLDTGGIFLIPFAGLIVNGIVLAFKYILSKRTLFFVEYAGGKIMFDAALIGIADVNDFQKQIRRVKDKVVGKK